MEKNHRDMARENSSCPSSKQVLNTLRLCHSFVGILGKFIVARVLISVQCRYEKIIGVSIEGIIRIILSSFTEPVKCLAGKMYCL